MRTIILITGRFPYRPGEEFLEAELPYLAAQFDRVVIVPGVISGTPREVPPRVEIETGLASASSIRILGKLSCIARHPLLCVNAIIRGAVSPFAIRRAISTAYEASVHKEWFSSYLTHHVNVSESVLFYSYWTTIPILGARLAGNGRQNVVGIVARAHRFDLYVEECGDTNWPFHEKILRSLDRLFIVSEHGLRYLTSRYPWMVARAGVSRLGVDDFGVTEHLGAPNAFVVCSCAYLNPVKRIDLLIRALDSVGRENPATNIRWHHFGDGPLRFELEELAHSILPKNVIATFYGNTTNAQIRSFYRENFVNVFVNTSSSEGVPVSIMEAQCAAIPVIATAVGGTPELVNASNGLLLPESPGVVDVAAAIGAAINEPHRWLDKRKESRQTWQTMSDATKNYSHFAHQLGQFFECSQVKH